MKSGKAVLLLCCAAVLPNGALRAQTVFYPSPARVFGHDSVTLRSNAPNLVEGRELNGPQSVALDTTVSPPILYVSDTLNNRVLGWRNALAFSNGQRADIVIGQRDMFTTVPMGPGTAFSGGLFAPTGIAVDSQGNLYVADSGNSRILRYRRPFDPDVQPDAVKMPDRVIGQESISSGRSPNRGGPPTAATVSLATGVGAGFTPFRSALAFWTEPITGTEFLYFTDAGNHRVLRYLVSEINSRDGASAALVLGQPNLTSNTSLPNDAQANRTGMRLPTGVAVDDGGRIYVADGLHRVLVFSNPLPAGSAAVRILGVVVAQPGQTVPPVNDVGLRSPAGVAMIGNRPAVIDSGNNRILVYEPYGAWPDETPTAVSPRAATRIGQPNFNTGDPGGGSTGFTGPVQAVFSGSELFVADSLNNRVIVFPEPFNAATRVLGQDGFEFNGPNLVEGRELSLANGGGIVVDAQSDPPRLFIADTGNNRVLGFRDARNVRPGQKADIVIGQPDLLRSRPNYNPDGTSAPSDYNLNGPIGLALDADGNLFVADSGNSRVLRFPKPSFDVQQPLPRANLVLGQLGFTTRNTDPSLRTMALPWGLAFTPEGHLLVSDATHNRVLMFSNGAAFSNGMQAAKVFGQPNAFTTAPGSDTNQMSGPRHIAADTSARLYVADWGNHRVLVFSGVADQPSFDARAVQALTNATQNAAVRNPQGIFVSQATGEIWVTETGAGTNRVTRYPEFFAMAASGNFTGSTVLTTGASGVPSVPLAITLDASQNLVVAESSSRVSMFFPASFSTNGANFLPNPLVAGSMTRACCAPGMIATAWPLSADGFGHIETAHAPSLPLPTTLSDVELLVSGPGLQERAVPLYYVSSGQINFQVPMAAPSVGTIDAHLVRRSTGQVLAAGALTMGPSSPGLFTNSFPSALPPGAPANLTALQVAVLNEDNSCNGQEGTQVSPLFCPGGVRPARQGDMIQIFATGQGLVSNAPADGASANGQVTSERPAVVIGTSFADVEFSGLAPGFVGLWQINARVPGNVAPGAARLVVNFRDINSSVGFQPLTVIQVRAR